MRSLNRLVVLSFCTNLAALQAMAQSIQLHQKEVGVKNANGTAMGPEGPTRGGLFSLTLTKERK